MAKSPIEKVRALAEAAKQKSQQVSESEAIPKAAAPKKSRLRKSGKSAYKIGREVEQTLKRFAQQQGIEQFDLFPGREYPTPFTRLPIFPPVQRKRARSIQAEATQTSDFYKLESRWDKGGVWKSGPALTVYDEDTLIGLLQLRSIGFSGNEDRMPDKVLEGRRGKTFPIGKGREVVVHAGYCVVSQLESVIRGEGPPDPSKGWGGKVIRRRRESLQRLGAQVLMFQSPYNLDQYRGKQIQMIQLEWIGDEGDACYYVQFHPAIVVWLEEYRTFIDLAIRRQLTPFGRALHRFLSSQRSNHRYKIELEAIAEAIGHDAKLATMKKQAQPQLKRMIELGFLESAIISGTGRRTPFMLSVIFGEKTSSGSA